MLLYTYLQRVHAISRRDFTDMLAGEVIHVNDNPITDRDAEVNKGDTILINLPGGDTYTEKVRSIHQHKPVMVVFNKPRGYVCSKKDEHNKTIYDLLPASWQKDFWYVGRLDKDSYGLLLLTNSSKLVDYYQSPHEKIKKIYEVRTNKPIKTQHKDKMRKGLLVDSEGVKVDPKDQDKYEGVEMLGCAGINPVERDNTYLRVVLTEGKNRHIRRMFIALGYEVKDLQRIKFGKFEIGNVKSGKYRIYKA